MAERPAPPLRQCRACNRHFDSVKDLCAELACHLCKRCHITALGQPQPHAFNDTGEAT